MKALGYVVAAIAVLIALFYLAVLITAWIRQYWIYEGRGKYEDY